MHGFLRKKLLRRFDAEMRRSFPKLRRVRDATWPRTPVYRAAIGNAGHTFVALEVSSKYNAYCIELAHAVGDTFPWDADLSSSLDEARGSEGRLRVVAPSGQADAWWNVVTGGQGRRDDRPSGPEAWTQEAIRARLREDVDPEMAEHVDACVADTIGALREQFPRYLEHAARELLAAARSSQASE
jgi:hypothetical protein